MSESPVFKHDCDSCVFLGSHKSSDLYFCNFADDEGFTVIARHSSDPADYVSGVELAPFDSRIDMALTIASALGYASVPNTDEIAEFLNSL